MSLTRRGDVMLPLRAWVLRRALCRRGQHHLATLVDPAVVSFCVVPGCHHVEPWPWWR